MSRDQTSESAALDPKGGIVKMGDVLLRSPGLEGIAEVLLPTEGPGGTRAPGVERTTEDFEAALKTESLQRQLTVAISRTERVPVHGKGLRSTAFGEPAIEARIPAPGREWGQLVLAVDEAGVSRWCFPLPEKEEPGSKSGSTRGSRHNTYLIPRQVPPATGKLAKTRGLASAVGSKLFKVLVFPLVDPLVGKLEKWAAGIWEKKKRPYGIRALTPESFREARGPEVASEDWTRISSGRSLLLIHGTFSRSHTAFGGMPAETFSNLYKAYGGRVWGFDHYTMSEDPRQNVQWLLDRIPEGTALDLDVLCHSRGGLVSRVLAEKQSDLSLGSRRLDVKRVVFVASPNSGTILTDNQYMGDFLDTYTNLLDLFPSNGVVEVLEGILFAVKMLALGALKGLPGLRSMLPGGDFLEGLNRGPQGDGRYYALASDYGPKDPGFRAWAVDRLLDKVFKVPNDLVVPTAGVYDIEGDGGYSFTDSHVFAQESGVAHSSYFSNPEAQERLLKWLNGAE